MPVSQDGESDSEATGGVLIPKGLFAPGRIDRRLPMYIGQIVMLSALLDRDVAVMAGTVQDRDPDVYLAQDVAKNIGVCRRRFRCFSEPWQVDIVGRAGVFLTAVGPVIAERNEIVHRIWSIATGEQWGGYKGSRSLDLPSRERERQAGWSYSPQRMEEIVDRMATLADRGRDVVGLVTSLPSNAMGKWGLATAARADEVSLISTARRAARRSEQPRRNHSGSARLTDTGGESDSAAMVE